MSEDYSELVAQKIPVEFSCFHYLEQTFGVTRGLLRDMNSLGFVLAGGAAGALSDIARGHDPVSEPTDIDFFYKGVTSSGPALRTLPGLATQRQRSLAVTEVLHRNGFEYQDMTAFSIHYTKILEQENKKPASVQVPWGFNRINDRLERPAVGGKKVNLQVITLAEIGQPRFDTLPAQLEPHIGRIPVWSRFDFTVVRAELDGPYLIQDPQLLRDRETRTLRLRHLNRNPLYELSRIHKYVEKGYSISAHEWAKLFVMADRLPPDIRVEFDEYLIEISDLEFLVEDTEVVPDLEDAVLYGGLQSRSIAHYRKASKMVGLNLSSDKRAMFDIELETETQTNSAQVLHQFDPAWGLDIPF